MLPHAEGEVLNDEVVIIHSPGSTGESEVFKPYTGVCLPDVLDDVGGRSEALREWRSPDTPRQRPVGLGPQGWDSGRLADDRA